jgi:integrase
MGVKAPERRVTTRELWELYQVACWDGHRPATQRNYTDGWKKWELFAGRDFIVEDVTPAMLHRFRAFCERESLGVNTIATIVKVCKLVHSWGEREEVISRNRWRLYRYKVAKDQKPEPPPEYSTEEAEAILAHLSPKGRGWRPWAAITFLYEWGVRANTVVHLRWQDIHLRGRYVEWPLLFDKTGKPWKQPLTKPAIRALRVCRDRAKKHGVTSPYVLFSSKHTRPDLAYTPQSLWAGLMGAEARAGVIHRKQRAAHSIRRRVSNEFRRTTSDPLLGLRAIGDSDVRQLRNYQQDNLDDLRGAFKTRDRARADRARTKAGNDDGV